MSSTGRLLYILGLLLLAFSIPRAQSQNESTQIAPSSTITDAASAQSVPEIIEPSASLSGSESVIRPSMMNVETSSATQQQSTDRLDMSAVASAYESIVPSSDKIAEASNSLDLSAPELSGASATLFLSSSEDLNSLNTLTPVFSTNSANHSTFLVGNTTLMTQNLSGDIQSTAALPADSVSLSAVNYSIDSANLSPSVTEQSSETTANEEPVNASLSAPGDSMTATMTATAAISPSSTMVVAPSSSVLAPGGGPSGGSTPQQGEEGEKDGGGGGGMSSGAKAAVGIFVSLAIVGFIAVAVVLYRRNYLTPRNIKSLMKGGVRYQTHNDSMSYNDEIDLLPSFSTSRF